jgi:hypothetical protein
MKRWAVVLVVTALLGLPALQRAGADDEKKTPTIKQVMAKLHKGSPSLLKKVGDQLQEEAPPWEAIQKETKDFVILGAALAKNEPPRGDKDSWEKLAQKYYDNAKVMDDAAQKKDDKAALAAHKKLFTSCAACHAAHKPRPRG